MDQIARQPIAPTFNWPDNHRIAVIVTVLLENWAEGKAPPYGPMTTALRPGTIDHAGITWSEYGGKAGIWRLMRILDRRRIKATIVANVRSIELHGAAMRQAVASGHEIAAHSYTQDQLLAYMDRDEELATIQRCKRAFTSEIGHSPAGWLSPVVACTANTSELLAQEGFLWHGDCNDADLPGIKHTPHGAIVTLPHTDFADNRVLRQSPQDYFDAYRETFDYLYRHEPGGMINLTLHCQFGGRPLTAAAFDRILDYMQQAPDVWFPRHDEMATWFRGLGVDDVPYARRFFPHAT